MKLTAIDAIAVPATPVVVHAEEREAIKVTGPNTPRIVFRTVLARFRYYDPLRFLL